MVGSAQVAIGYVHATEVAASFTSSLLALVACDSSSGRRHLGDDPIVLTRRCRTADELPAARNEVVQRFLSGPRQWLLFLDTDMGFKVDTLSRLAEHAHPVGTPIVGALAFASREDRGDGMGGHRTHPQPTIFDRVDLGDGTRRWVYRPVYRPGVLNRCEGTGAACILIHRGVFERLGDGGWYDRIPGDTGLVGEDLSFCQRARDAGYPIVVHAGVRTSHLKPRWVAELDFWGQYLPPPAVEHTAVVVPVLGRPDHAEPFMQSLRASTGLARVYAVLSPTDAPNVGDAWRRAGVDERFTIPEEPGTFARKVNYVYPYVREPWLLLVGSDVRFWPGWLDHAQHMAAVFGANVVGTNDLGNPRVVAGEHATHMLIRRQYVEERGASWDGPGVVCHPGYRHWYVDDEVVTVAKQRGEFVAAPGSVVEHLHPLFGKGIDDEVYHLGQSVADTDAALFTQRAAQFSGL